MRGWTVAVVAVLGLAVAGADGDGCGKTEEGVDLADVECDFDGDGELAPGCGGDDCDDDDAGTYPGALEVCDFNDNDCDPWTNEGYDNDGDGVALCGGASNGTYYTADCDDTDPEIGRSLEGDDLDRDGWFNGASEALGEYRGDCDDCNPAVHPNRPEIVGDRVDSDCDDLLDE